MRYFFFFQAEDGIRDGTVTGVQTCALPVADQDVRRHGEQAPDQDLGDESPPEFGQDERRDGQEREDDAETGPVGGGRAAHRYLGVGTKRPVGLNRSVRIRATNETMTAWA